MHNLITSSPGFALTLLCIAGLALWQLIEFIAQVIAEGGPLKFFTLRRSLIGAGSFLLMGCSGMIFSFLVLISGATASTGHNHEFEQAVFNLSVTPLVIGVVLGVVALAKWSVARKSINKDA